jgi:hypothetical protein
MVIPRIWLPALYAPLFSILFVYMSSAIVGYTRGGEVLPRRLRRFIGWTPKDDQASSRWRVLGPVFFAGFLAVQEWVALGISLREQLDIGNSFGVLLLAGHVAFAVGWTAYLAHLWSRRVA